MCDDSAIAEVMLSGAAMALRRHRKKRSGEEEDELEQDEDKVSRTLIGEDIPGVRKILPEHMPYGPMPSGGHDGRTLIGGG